MNGDQKAAVWALGIIAVVAIIVTIIVAASHSGDNDTRDLRACVAAGGSYHASSGDCVKP